MKKWLALTLLVPTLAACGVPAVKIVPTIIPTNTATIPPTLTIEPSPTVDPNMPEGTTGKDAQGNYIKTVTEKGIPLTYEWNAEMEGWFRLLTPESIPALDFKEANLIPITVHISENVEGGQTLNSFTFLDNTTGPFGYYTVTGNVIARLYHRYYGNNPSTIPVSFNLAILNREVPDGANPITFTTHDGETHTWIPGQNIGVKVFIRSWNELELVKGNGVVQWKDPYNTSFRSRIGMDADGNITSEIAPRVPLSSLSDEQLRSIVVLHLARVLDGPGDAEGYSTYVNIFATVKDYTGLNPYIQINRNP